MQGVSIDNIKLETDDILGNQNQIKVDFESIKQHVRSSLINVSKR